MRATSWLIAAVLTVSGIASYSSGALAGTSGPEGTCFGRAPTIVGTDGDDVIHGTGRADVIVAGAGDDQVYGGGGNDRICGGAGNDRLWGGSGDDRLDLGDLKGWEEFAWGGRGSDLLRGGGDDPNGDGIWQLHGGPGSDHLVTASGTRYLAMYGGRGDDRLDGTSGSVAMHGGSGNDVLTGSWFFDGGTGNDVMRGSGLVSFADASSVRVDLTAGTAVGDGFDRIEGITGVTGSPGNDVIAGTDGADQLDGAGGDDRIRGGAGDDILVGGPGNDVVRGGPGNDAIGAAPGHDTSLGGPGNDQLSNETAFGSSDYRNPANSTFDGGDGEDAFSFHLSRSLAAEPVTIDLEGASSVGGHPMEITGVESVNVDTEGQIVLRGTEQANKLLAKGETSVISGRGGNDTLDGSSTRGSVTLDGGDGIDRCLNGDVVTNCELLV